MGAVKSVEWGVLVRLKKFCSRKEWSRISELRGSVIAWGFLIPLCHQMYVFFPHQQSILCHHLGIQHFNPVLTLSRVSIGPPRLEGSAPQDSPTSDASYRSQGLPILQTYWL